MENEYLVRYTNKYGVEGSTTVHASDMDAAELKASNKLGENLHSIDDIINRTLVRKLAKKA